MYDDKKDKGGKKKKKDGKKAKKKKDSKKKKKKTKHKKKDSKEKKQKKRSSSKKVGGRPLVMKSFNLPLHKGERKIVKIRTTGHTGTARSCFVYRVVKHPRTSSVSSIRKSTTH